MNSLLTRGYQYSRRHLQLRLNEPNHHIPLTKRNYRSTLTSVATIRWGRGGPDEYRPKLHRHGPVPVSLSTCSLRLFSSTNNDDDKADVVDGDSGDEVDILRSSLRLVVPDDDDDDDDDRIPFENELDDDSDSDDDDEANSKPELVAEGMFDLTKTSALAALNNYYCNEYGYKSVTKQFRTEQVNIKWLATFVCPETGIEYPQGSLRSDEQGAAVEISPVDGRYTNGRPAYQKKSTAIHAAAARVLDIIQFQKLHIIEPRFCKENPALFQTQLVAVDETDHGETAHDSVNYDAAAAASMAKYVVEQPSPQFDSAQQISGVTNDSETAVQDEEEYTIAVVATPSGQADPSKRLLQAFSSGQDASLTATAANAESNRMPITTGPLRRIKLAVEVAKSWVEANTRLTDEVARNPHRMHLPTSPSNKTQLIGKTLLESLAEANQSFAVSGARVGCEWVAWQILDVMRDHDGNEKPDTEAYNLLMKCLEGNSPRAVAEKAEVIFNDMQSGLKRSGRVLPKPNSETMNTLIQLWAQVGGITGRYHRLGDDFVPNRDSFLCVLSSCCYIPDVSGEDGGLDISFATECIRRMRELSEANPDDLSLEPDIQVYNAPLRWTGGSFARQSRPYARAIPWDYTTYFYGDDGPCPFDSADAKVVEAQSIENWIDIMQDQGVQPNIETYEALIQAWLRTATRVGLDRAQNIAEDLLAGNIDGVTPRLQTFRPLTRCWIFSREADAGQKVQDLIGRLESVSAQVPDLRPDSRFYKDLIAANKCVISIRHRQSETPINELFKISERCSAILDSLYSQLQADIANDEAPDVFFETLHFVDTMEGWQYAAAACILNKSSDSHTEQLQYALTEWARIIDMHDGLIQTLLREESSDGMGLRLRREYSFQLRHLVMNSGCFYSSFILGLKRLGELQRRSSGGGELGDILLQHIHVLERIVRRSGEMEIAASHDTGLKLERMGIDDSETKDARIPLSDTVVYGDYFPGHKLRKQNAEAASRNVLLSNLVDCLQSFDFDNADVGDLARLLLLIKTTAQNGDVLPAVSNIQSIDGLLNMISTGRISEKGSRKHNEVYDPRTTRGRRKVRAFRTKAQKKQSSPTVTRKRKSSKI